MITAKIETITPDIAAAILQGNDDNRRLSEKMTAQFASDMKTGKWKLTGQPIIISSDGQLNDGQHRLSAVIKSGVAVEMMVIRGADRHTRDAIDTGKPRGSGDILQMFHIADGNAIAALAQIVLSYERTDGKFIGDRSSISKSDVINRAKTDERLQMASRVGWAGQRITTRKHVSFARYVIPDSPLSNEFFERLIDGAGLDHGHPVLTVRNWFLRSGRRMPDAQAVEALLRAWCAMRDGRTLSRIQLMGELPKP